MGFWLFTLGTVKDLAEARHDDKLFIDALLEKNTQYKKDIALSEIRVHELEMKIEDCPICQEDPL